MVNIIVENLLSTAINRALYQALWSLSLSKSCKPENIKSCESFSIAAICNELIQEIRRDDPDPNKFYFSSQLAFGVIQLYRFQIDKLLSQVKTALETCKATFFDIDWLSRMSETQAAENTQLSYQLPIVKKKGTKNQQQKTNNPEPSKLQPLSVEIDLIEKALTIPDAPELVTKKNGKKQISDDTDPTMANSAREITIVEKFQPRPNVDFQSVIGDEVDEFGGHFFQDEPFFSVPSQMFRKLSVAQEDDQKVPELNDSEELPDVLRSAENPRTASPNYDLLEPTLSNDIMEIVNQQRPSRKRSLSETLDVSVRIERAAKALKLSNFELDTSNNISPFDHNANEVETVENAELPAPESFFPCDTSDILVVPLIKTKAPTAQKPRKARQKKRKLVIDKTIKITDQELKDNMEQYQRTMTNSSPLETFLDNMFRINHSAESFWMTPATRLKFCAGKSLLPLFERNLKVLKLKRPRQEANSPEYESPPKKRMLRPKNTDVQQTKTTDIDAIIPELPPIEEIQLQVPEFEDFPLTLPIIDLPPPKSLKKQNKKSQDESRGYQENEKWSKHKIVESLNDFWNEDDETITMRKLCAKTNRFVAAGIFFELMVLSKEEAVELTQGEGLQIVNISPGQKVEIYI